MAGKVTSSRIYQSALSRTRPLRISFTCSGVATFSSGQPRHRGGAQFLRSHGSSELLRGQHQIKSEKKRKRTSPEQTRLIRRNKISGVGIVICALCMVAIAKSGAIPEPAKDKDKSSLKKWIGDGDKAGATLMDGPPAIAGSLGDGNTLSLGRDKTEQVPTGTSTIPTFPKTIQLSSSVESPPPPPSPDLNISVPGAGKQQVNYQLVGLGVRTVSFLGIQVYVVGLYVAVPDIAILQERLVRELDPVATTLVPAERQRLRELLTDPIQGEEIWDQILRDGGIRTAFRIVPTRSTDYMHLRDGWVRGLTSRSRSRTATLNKQQQQSASSSSDHHPDHAAEFDDESFGTSVNSFKSLFGTGARKSLPKGGTLLLTRDARGQMTVWADDNAPKPKPKPKPSQCTTTPTPAAAAAATAPPTVAPAATPTINLGTVPDERISRLIWLGYLAGKNVSSEEARRSVIDGLMEFVERPVGMAA